MKKTTPFLFACALCALLGCGSETKEVPYSQLADGDVLVSVNGVTYTKGELERDVGIRADLQKLSLEKASEVQVEALKEQFRRQALGQFVSRELLLAEAGRRKVELLPEDMLAYQEVFAKGLSAKVPVGFDAIGTVLGKRITDFRASLRKDALAFKLTGIIRRDAACVPMPTKEEAERTIAAARVSNAAFAVTNRVTAAVATNAWKSIKRGNDFATVGRKLCEMDRHIVYFDACNTTDPTAAKLAKGEITPPLCQEKALTIFKANAEPGVADRYSCIILPLAPIYVIESVEETRKTIYETTVEEAYKAKLDALRKAADIRYPCGEKILR